MIHNKINKDMIFIRKRYPDAIIKAEGIQLIVWCPLLKKRLSGFFNNPNDAWRDAREKREHQEADNSINGSAHVNRNFQKENL